MAYEPRRWLLPQVLAIVFVLVGTSCGGTSGSTATSLTTVAQQPASGASTQAIATYLVAVLESGIEAGIAEVTAALSTAASPQQRAEANRASAAAFGRQVEMLESLSPPSDAVAFHASLIDLTRRSEDLFTGLADVATANDEAELARLQQVSLSIVQDSVEMGAEQQRLIELVLASRSDPLSRYLLSATGSQAAFSTDVQGILGRLQQALALGDIDALVGIIDEERALMDASLERWNSLSPPEIATTYHDLQAELVVAMRDVLTAMLSAVENEDLSALETAARDFLAASARFGEVSLLQTELLITALG